MAEPNQATPGAPPAGEGTTQATETISAAEALYGKEPVKEAAKEPAPEGDQKPGEKKNWLDKSAEEAAKEGIPERYELKIPDGVAVNPELMTKFETLAKESGFTTEQAQRWADLHLESVGGVIREWTEMGEKRSDEVAAWAAEVDRDPYFGGVKKTETIDAAKRALSFFGTPEEVGRLKVELNRTGLGNHPVLVRGLARIARLLGDKAQPSNEGMTFAQILYPNQK